MRYGVYGLGAMGGCLAGRLVQSGADVCGVARGRTLEVIRQRGLTLQDAGGTTHADLPVADSLADLDRVDCVVVAVKATALPSVVQDLHAHLPDDAVVLTAMNGVPWWFTDGFRGPIDGADLDSVDPGGAMSRCVPATRVIGSAVHLTGSVPAPGTVSIGPGNELMIGAAAPDDRLASVADDVGKDLTTAGFDVTVTDDVRAEVWYKLWGNLSFNPVAMITAADAAQILADPLSREFVAGCMREAQQIGTRLGFTMEAGVEERLRIAEQLGPFRPSMLQDAEAGKPIELDALLASVREIGALLDLPTPHIDGLLGLARVHARAYGLYRA